MRQIEHHEHRAAQHHGRHVEVALVDVLDPLNVGQAFRLCAALGVRHLYLVGATPAPPNAKLNRTARGAQHEVSFSRCGIDALIAPVDPRSWAEPQGNSPQADPLKPAREERGFRQNPPRLIALEYSTASRDLRTVAAERVGQPVILLVGNEARGLSATLLESCDDVAHVPMYGQVSSLNVATALALGLWEFVR